MLFNLSFFIIAEIYDVYVYINILKFIKHHKLMLNSRNVWFEYLICWCEDLWSVVI